MSFMHDVAHWVAGHIGLVYGALLAVGLTLTTVLYRTLQRYRQHASATATLAYGTRGWVPVLGLLFALLAWRTQAGTLLPAFDAALAQAMASDLAPATVQRFAWLTHLADTATLSVLCVLVAGILLALRRRGLALWWVIALAGNGLLNLALKAAFARVRPEFDHALTDASGWSFPSGHSSGALVGYGMLALVICQALPPQRRLPVVLAAVALVLAIGLSRIALHVHYLSDVAAGFCSGALWLTLCVAGYYRQRERQAAGEASATAV